MAFSSSSSFPNGTKWNHRLLPHIISLLRIPHALQESSAGGDDGSTKTGCKDSIQFLCEPFKVIDEAKKDFGGALVGWDIPAIIVEGGQSTGKSTLLERLTNLQIFPKKEDLCTRLAIRIRLRYSTKVTASMKLFKIFDDGTEKHVGGGNFDLTKGEQIIQKTMKTQTKSMKKSVRKHPKRQTETKVENVQKK